jgi:hypothetical protein
MTFGVTPTGLVRPTQREIIETLEARARGVFGDGVIQSAESPLGQLNGLLSEAINEAWEAALDAYQSYDPDQAEGVRLDTLAVIRLLDRATGEDDAGLRQAITNQGRARIDIADIVRAVQNIDSVSYARLYVNDTASIDANGLSPNSIALAVIGGSDAEVATVLRDYVVPGIGTAGNVRVDTTIDGYCRSIWLIRPAPVRVRLALDVRVSTDRLGCPAPSAAAIQVALAASLSGAGKPNNGDDVTLHLLRTAVPAIWPNVEIVSATGARGSDALAALPVAIGFFEIANFAPADIAVTIVA